MSPELQMTAFGFLALAAALPAGPGGATSEDKPPSITYGGARTSRAWIETPSGQVAVDQGIEWQGIKVYLSLTWTLVAVDAKTDKTIWANKVSAFWNALAIKEVESEPGRKLWAVELRPTMRDPQASKLIALYDLKTGTEIKLPKAAEKPSGSALKLRKVYSGETTSIPRKFSLLVTTAENWTKVRERMFRQQENANAPAAADIDFSKEVVLVISAGDRFNCRGIECAEALEDDHRILVRLNHQTYQTIGEGVSCRPYGIFVLPRAEKKAYVAERDRQGLIGGPPLWTVEFHTEKLPDPAKELERLP